MADPRPIGVPEVVLSKRSLITLSHALEEEIIPSAESDLVVLACFQRQAFYAREAPRFERFAASCRHLLAAFHGAPAARLGSLQVCPLGADEPLASEWSLVFIGRETGVSLVALDRRKPEPREDSFEAARSFQARLCFQRSEAAREGLRILELLGSRVPDAVARDVRQALEDAQLPPTPLEARLGRIATGVVRSLEAAEQRTRKHEWALRAEQETSRRDTLTRLYNRRYLERYLGADLTTDTREADFALLLCDVDRFKSINDELGYAAGDAALKLIARDIQHATREGDVCVRWGGDEFLVLMPHRDLVAAQSVAERLLGRVRSAHREDLDVPLTLSIGIAAQGNAAELYQRADEALYRAKRAGRDRFEA